jgi:integrase
MDKPRRAKGTGRVYLRGKVWYARWRHNGEERTENTGIREGDTRDGKTARELAEEWVLDKTEPLRIRHRADGLAMIARQMQTLEERLAADIAETRRVATVGDLARMFRESARRPDCSEEMLAFYCRIAERMAAHVGADTPVADVGRAEADGFAKALTREKKAAGTFNKNINALSLVWRVCGPDAGLKDGENPWAGIARRRSDAHVRRAFSKDETDAIVAAAEGEMRTLAAVLLYTGLRLGDACGLRWEDIRGDAVFVTTAKRDRKVAIPLHPKLAANLGRRKASGPVMPGMAARYAKSNGASNVGRSIQRLLAKCGIETSVKCGKGRKRPDATAHSFRHTFVSRAIEAGVPPHVVQAIVGHASGTMTEHYTHLGDETILKAFGTME